MIYQEVIPGMIYVRAIMKWGLDNQVLMTIEEPAELIKEIVKLKRGKANEEHMAEEVADVLIVCEQLLSHYGRAYGGDISGYMDIEPIHVIGHLLKLQREAYHFLTMEEGDRNHQALCFRLGQAHLYTMIFARSQNIEALVENAKREKLKRLEARL